MNKLELDLGSVRSRVADIFEQQLGLPRELTLAGGRFADLDPGFDSLSLFQTLLYIEEAYGVEFERSATMRLSQLPGNLDELVALVHPRLCELHAKR